MIFNINSTRGQTRFLTCVARVTCLMYILLKSVGVRKRQVTILAKSSREMSVTVRIVGQYILSRVRVSVRPCNFFIREIHPKPRVNLVVSACLTLNDSATGYEWQRSGASRLGATNSGNTHGCDGGVCVRARVCVCVYVCVCSRTRVRACVRMRA